MSWSRATAWWQYLWAFPATSLGLVCAAAALAGGGRARTVDGVLEVTGPTVLRALSIGAVPLPGGISAITLGHVVLGTSPLVLQLTRTHERVHVRQYERWGPGFIPAYGLASLWVWFRGGDAYRDNPFEQEAYRVDDPSAELKSAANGSRDGSVIADG
jgi:hypothetical protein